MLKRFENDHIVEMIVWKRKWLAADVQTLRSNARRDAFFHARFGGLNSMYVVRFPEKRKQLAITATNLQNVLPLTVRKKRIHGPT